MDFSTKFLIQLRNNLKAYKIKLEHCEKDGNVTYYQFYKQLKTKTGVCVIMVAQYCNGCQGYSGSLAASMFWHKDAEVLTNQLTGVYAHVNEIMLADLINDMIDKCLVTDTLTTSLGALHVSLS